MKRHRSHQIDKLAQEIFEAALPKTWVPNKQQDDYAKDYVIEIGENNGDLTGSSFYVQLKGQESVAFSANDSLAKFPLETKYAAYYLDKVKDLPVFLVVVDVNKRRGWWLFLQTGLATDQSWRQKKTVMISLPVTNDLADTAKLRQGVETAKRMMRLLHPESIQDAIAAQKQHIRAIDPRFDVKVSLVNDTPLFELLPIEPVSGRMEFKGNRRKIAKKVSDLLDKGVPVAFSPGEVAITGSKLFEQFNLVGGTMQYAMKMPGTLTFFCKDSQGHELGRLAEVPGRFTGGRKEIWFAGGLANAPLALKIGPIAPASRIPVNINIELARWNGQKLLHLAYFDRLFAFFKELPSSAGVQIECQLHGNVVLTGHLSLQKTPFAIFLGRHMTLVHKARRVAAKFGINPAWSFETFDSDEQETAEQLYGIFFEDGWREKKPNIRINVEGVRKTKFDVLKQAENPGFVRMASDYTCTLLNEKIEVGRLVREYSEMTISLNNGERKTKGRAKTGRKPKPTTKAKRQDDSSVGIVLTGSPNTVMIFRKAEAGE